MVYWQIVNAQVLHILTSKERPLPKLRVKPTVGFRQEKYINDRVEVSSSHRMCHIDAIICEHRDDPKPNWSSLYINELLVDLEEGSDVTSRVLNSIFKSFGADNLRKVVLTPYKAIILGKMEFKSTSQLHNACVKISKALKLRNPFVGEVLPWTEAAFKSIAGN